MVHIFFDILSVVGALSVFLFGMKLMSDALQKMAGVRMRNILAAITSNKFKSVMAGLVVTAIIQSSSATTVMFVSFVNAGLLSLAESAGLIMGANIGTTLKAWLFVAIGVNIKLSQYALPIVALFFPLLFSKRNLLKYTGEFAMGFAFIFLGLDLLYAFLPDLTANPAIASFLEKINGTGAFSIIIFAFVGFAIAAIFQSSSTAMVFTLSFSAIGLINFPAAAAMVIGENIGTSITANLAAIIANEQAKKAARIHFLFNFIGAVWILSCFPIFLKTIDFIINAVFQGSPYTDSSLIPWALAITHTSFNVINTLILIWFIPLLIKAATILVKKPSSKDENFHLPFITKTIFQTSEISVLQARKEIVLYSKRIKSMFKLVKSIIKQVNEEEFNTAFAQIRNFEEMSDQIEVELSSYLTKLGQGDLSSKSNETIKLMMKLTGHLESISDNCYNIAKAFKKKRQAKVWFTQEIRDNINQMLLYIEEALEVMHENLDKEYSLVTIEKAQACEEKINLLRNNLKQDYTSNEDKNYKYEAGVMYNDIFLRFERLGDHIYNITKTIVQSTK